MIIESEEQYQRALNRITELYNAEAGTKDYEELQDLVAEVKIYEHQYHPEGKPEEQTFEFWTAKKGVVKDTLEPDDYEVTKLKESELTEEHVKILVAEFINNFNKLPPAAKRKVRKHLQY